MSKKLCFVLSITITATILLAACAPAAAPTGATAAPSQPTIALGTTAAVPITAAMQFNRSLISVGLVTDSNGVRDHAFNQLAWEGLQKAAKEMGFEATVIESKQPSDYAQNIATLATAGSNVIVTVGSQMGDATALQAKRYPTIRFAIIDNAYVPTKGSHACADTVTNCYADGGLTNVTSLMFAEDQVGFLAGVLAGGMSKSGFVCSVSSLKTPASERYVISFRAGAVWQGGEAHIRSMNNYINMQTTHTDIPSFTDSTEGKETAQNLIGSGCDMVFGVAANGALLAAKENNMMAIGVDVDQYTTDPEVKDALLSSAQKHVDVAVYTYLKAVADGSVTAGISIGTLQNGGVGLAPFHNWNSTIPADLKAQIQQASDGIKDGSITLNLP